MRCARSEPAALRAAFDADGDRSVFEAAEAAFALVRFELPVWARSDPAALLAAFEAVWDRSVFEAAEAARELVLPERGIDIL